MKSWKKQLKTEFDRATPALRDDVKNAPIMANEQSAALYETERPVIKKQKSILARRIGMGTAFTALAAALVIAFMGILGVFNPAVTPVTTDDKFVYVMEINPAAAFVTDKDGTVISVNALNQDADVILSDENTLNKIMGCALAEAVVTYTDSAAKLGYLDITATQNAVRFSGGNASGESFMAAAAENLKTYFKEKGIYAVVVENLIGVKDMCDRLGVEETESFSELTDLLKDYSLLYGERQSTAANEEELQDLYQTYVLGVQMLEYVRDELLENVADIVSNAYMLQQMGLCGYNIMLHEDNPLKPIPADYWTIKKYSNGEYTADFAELMQQMEDLLGEYESKFGKAITSTQELMNAADVYSSLNGVDFEKEFSAITVENFRTYAAKYIGILENIGFDVTALKSLLIVPSNAAEYISQFQTVLNKLFQDRTEQYKSIYEQPREAISSADYQTFINNIIKEYGSLENFWNKRA